MWLQTLTLMLLIPAVLACLYYLALAVAGLLLPARSHAAGKQARRRFAIVIPAHQEEMTISRVLQSCAGFDYPVGRCEVFVIADNCADRTAAVARAWGARCLERVDAAHRGKGYALAWALPQVLATRPDAVIVLDADCRLDSHALRVFDRCLADGHAVLQVNNVAANPDASITSYIAAVANRLENDLFYAPKSRLGLAVLLRGTGMVFRRDVLEQQPWQAHSSVEDAEYTIRLQEADQRVHFVPEVRVLSDFPEAAEELRSQRSRWIGGTARLGAVRGVGLMVSGLLSGKRLQFDLGWTLLAATRTLVLVELLAAVATAALSAWLVPGALSNGMLATGIALIGLYLGYFGLGIARLGLTSKRLAMLWKSPAIIGRMMLIGAASVLPGSSVGWVKTRR